MYLAYKENTFVTKLTFCLLITIFAFMCLYGSFTYAVVDNTSINYPGNTEELINSYMNNSQYYINNNKHLNYIICSNYNDDIYLLFFTELQANYDGGSWATLNGKTDYGARIYPAYYSQKNGYNGNYRFLYKLVDNTWVTSTGDAQNMQYSIFLTSTNSRPSSAYNYNNYSDQVLFISNTVSPFTNIESHPFERYAPNYTDISNLPENYYLLSGSRPVADSYEPVHIYCNSFLSNYKYFLAFYSEFTYTGRTGDTVSDGYFFDIFFSNYPIYLQKNSDFSAGNSSYTVYCDGDEGFYHLQLSNENFNNMTVNFNLTDFTINDYTYCTKEENFTSSLYNTYNIIYFNYPLLLKDDYGRSYLTNFYDNGVLYPIQNTTPSDENLPTNTVSDIYDNFVNNDNTTDFNQYVNNEDNQNDFDYNSEKDGIKSRFGDIFHLFSFTDSIQSIFNDVYNFIFNTTEAPIIKYNYYTSVTKIKAISKNYNAGFTDDGHSTGGFSGNGRMGYFSVSNNNENIISTDENINSITIFDFSWYAPYKKYCDLIIAGFIYLSFIWHLFRNAPNIISGVSSQEENIDTFIHRKGMF